MEDSNPAEDAFNLRRAVILRWWLLAAVAIAVSSAPTLLDIALPRLPMFAVLALMAGFNAFLEWRSRAREAVGAGNCSADCASTRPLRCTRSRCGNSCRLPWTTPIAPRA